MYVQSPLDGMSENEMINEARIRLAHNRQRQKLKQLLATSANGGPVVNTRDLLLACKLAKLDMGSDREEDTDRFVKPQHVAARDYMGSPRAIAWKGFHKSIAYPEIHAPGQFPGTLPMTKQQKAAYQEYQAQQAVLNAPVQQDEDLLGPERVSDEEVAKWHKQLKRMMETRFSELRRAFRMIDMDNSGKCDRAEMKEMLTAMFNVDVPEAILDRLIDLADYDGDGEISFAEFARISTEDDVFNMKQTLQADLSGWGTNDPAVMVAEINKQAAAAQRRKAAQGGYTDGGYHPKLRKTGPSLDEMRRAHKTLKKAIAARYGSPQDAFKSIDADGSGTLRRNELRRFLTRMVKTIPDRVISGLIDFCDDDGDGRTLSRGEFTKLMNAEYLGAGGFDPNAHLVTKK